ncbi:unnamed protein product, partial [Symbiodinium pilosum]
LRDWFKSGRAPLDAMFSTKKWAEMRQMQLNYSQDLQENSSVDTGRTQRVAIGLVGLAVFVVIVVLGSHTASPARASARDVVKFEAVDGSAEKQSSSVEEREKVSVQVEEMQSQVAQIQEKLEFLKSALDSCGA